MSRTFCAIALACLVATQAVAGTGTIIKYNQPIGHLINPTNMMGWGEDIPSDVDWNKVMQTPTLNPNWVIADDFRDPVNLPVLTVKWWGSYVGPTFQQNATGPPTPIFGPGSEDGYLVSFFSDIPDPDGSRDNPEFWSRPGRLLGSYVLPFDKIRFHPTPFVGWHDPGTDPNDPRLRIWEYEADLMDAHFDHGIAGGPAKPNGFFQKPGETYWISIVAEVGHKLTLETTATGEVRWIAEDTHKFAEEHYWGWHTSPRPAGDLATMSHLFMPGGEWQYLEDWRPIEPHHMLHDMAFQLKTVPEPSSVALGMLAVTFGGMIARRRRP